MRFLIFLFLVNFCMGSMFSQTAVNTVNVSTGISMPGGTITQSLLSHSSSVNGVLPNQNYQHQFQNSNNTRVVDFNLAGRTFVNFATFDTVFIRRASNAFETTNGNKQHIYCDGPATINNTTFQLNFPVAFPFSNNENYMETVMKQGFINRGSDNIFNNDGTSDLTFNNIERIDFVYRNGLFSTDVTKAGFLITERGGNDPFKIAAITGIDANGNPTSFSSIRTVAANAYGNSMINIHTYVLRKDVAQTSLRVFSKVPAQDVRSVFIRFSDLGVSPLQRVFGYAIMGVDVTATTSSQILDFTNPTFFPRTTNNTNGGMDMASAPGIFHTDLILSGNQTSISLSKVDCNNVINIECNTDGGIKEIEFEKSVNSIDFYPIGKGVLQNKKASLIDQNSNGISYYRAKIVELNGSFFYSNVIFSRESCKNVQISIFPNPVQNELHIQSKTNDQIQRIQLVNQSGAAIKTWSQNTTSSIVTLDISTMPSGVYSLIIVDKMGNNTTKTFIKK